MSAQEATSTALVLHPATGEVIDLATATTEDLAAGVAQVDKLRRELTDFESALGGELLARLDRGAKWTLRAGDPKGEVQWEVKAPSPTAGTVSYDPRVLERELASLIEAGVVSEEAAGAAVARTLTVVVRVPFAVNLDELAKLVEGVDAIAGQPVSDPTVTGVRKTVAAGVTALAKVPGTAEALDAARETAAQPSRRVRVKAVTKR